jgi:hypothetical protein
LRPKSPRTRQASASRRRTDGGAPPDQSPHGSRLGVEAEADQSAFPLIIQSALRRRESTLPTSSCFLIVRAQLQQAIRLGRTSRDRASRNVETPRLEAAGGSADVSPDHRSNFDERVRLDVTPHVAFLHKQDHSAAKHATASTTLADAVVDAVVLLAYVAVEWRLT